MKDKKKINKKGLLFLIPGLLCILVGFIDFFSAGMPQLFFLFFIGMPLTFIGIVLLTSTNFDKIARYRSQQINPILKDTIDYMAENKIMCPKCDKLNEKDSQYCENCGCSLNKFCPYCGEDISHDAKFCNKCGKKIC